MANKRYVASSGTFSKDSEFWGKDFPVQSILEGQGARVKGEDGNWYLDWVSGLGAIILGYGDTVGKGGFAHALRAQAAKGISFSLPSHLEYEVAELLVNKVGKAIPGWQRIPLQVKWLKTGSDACNAAIRLARAVTGRDTIVSFGYHGWADTFIGATPPAWGIKNQNILAVDNEELMELVHHTSCPRNYAAVIIEDPLNGFSEEESYVDLRKWCTKNGILLIVDEVVTGLRYGLGGACALHNIQPDLVCLGKSLGNGMPIAALMGPVEHMSWFERDDPVFVSSTNAGDAMSLVAARYVLDNWNEEKVVHLITLGMSLMDNSRWPLIGCPARMLHKQDSPEQRAFLIHKMATDFRILLNRPIFVNDAHTQEDVNMTINALGILYDKWHSDPVRYTKEYQNRVPRALFANR